MPDLDRQAVSVSDQDKQDAFSKVNLFGSVILRKISEMQKVAQDQHKIKVHQNFLNTVFGKKPEVQE